MAVPQGRHTRAVPHRQDPIDETERLRRALVHLETAQRIGRMGSWSGELTHDYELYWSPETRAIVGWGQDWPEPTFAQFLELVHPADRDRYVEMRDAAFAGDGPYEIDCRYLTMAGETKHVHVAAEIERDDQGRPIRLIGVVQDVSDSVHLFEQLLETEAARRDVLHRLMHTTDDERARLANDLHDGPIQELTAVALRLEHVAAQSAEGGADALRPALDGLHRVIQALRSTLFELNPTALGREGIRSTLEYLVRTSAPDIDTTVLIEAPPDLDDPVATTIIRIAQEALHNIRKHAAASRVEVRLGSTGGDVALLIIDDGRGFDPSEGAPRGHLGLTAMRERAEAVGGELRIDSGPGGTTVCALLPLP